MQTLPHTIGLGVVTRSFVGLDEGLKGSRILIVSQLGGAVPQAYCLGRVAYAAVWMGGQDPRDARHGHRPIVLQRQCLTQVHQRFVISIGEHQDYAEIVVGVGIIGFEAQRRLEMDDGIIKPLQPDQGDAEIILGIGPIRTMFERAPSLFS